MANLFKSRITKYQTKKTIIKMKVKIKTQKKELSSNYPVLMYLVSHPKEVVLFENANSGTLVSSGNLYDIKLGEYSSDWDISLFEKFEGKIILTN